MDQAGPQTREEIARDVQRLWQESAYFWDKHRATIAEMFAPLTDALIESAHIAAGHSVLDVGGGVGEPSLTIAKVVGPGGTVTCTDPIAPMIQSAEREAQRRGLHNMKFQQCPAESLPIPDDQFAAAVARLSAMFFADPPAALREILRVVKPGGRVSFVVWAPAEMNPFFYVITNVVDQYLPSPPTDPDAPGAFRFAEGGKLASLLRETGAVQVDERLLQFHIQADLPLKKFWTLRSELSDTLREKAKKLSSEQLAQIEQEVTAAAQPFFPNNQMNYPAAVIVVTGQA
ncbi:MAG: hypothetical protein DMF74_02215 [Acidobacteria bacterium]|nr:MAG: hypothetical protein DMF74_02215 [Acidobacteriota bacterium]